MLFLFTGYRYYSVGQSHRLNRILVLKDLGLSLAQIARLLDGDLPPALTGRSTCAARTTSTTTQTLSVTPITWRMAQMLV